MRLGVHWRAVDGLDDRPRRDILRRLGRRTRTFFGRRNGVFARPAAFAFRRIRVGGQEWVVGVYRLLAREAGGISGRVRLTRTCHALIRWRPPGVARRNAACGPSVFAWPAAWPFCWKHRRNSYLFTWRSRGTPQDRSRVDWRTERHGTRARDAPHFVGRYAS